MDLNVQLFKSFVHKRHIAVMPPPIHTPPEQSVELWKDRGNIALKKGDYETAANHYCVALELALREFGATNGGNKELVAQLYSNR